MSRRITNSSKRKRVQPGRIPLFDNSIISGPPRGAHSLKIDKDGPNDTLD
jgi:hypothetical protein